MGKLHPHSRNLAHLDGLGDGLSFPACGASRMRGVEGVVTGCDFGEHRDFRSRAEHRRDVCKPGCKPESTLLQGEFERRAHLPLLVAIERTRRLAGDGEPEGAVPDKASHVLYRVCRL